MHLPTVSCQTFPPFKKAKKTPKKPMGVMIQEIQCNTAGKYVKHIKESKNRNT